MTTTDTSAPPAHEKRNIVLLGLAQGLGVSCLSLSVAVTPLAGASLAPSPGWATLPHALQFFALTLAATPAAFLSRRMGRRAGLSLGATVGLLAGVLASSAMINQSFALLCLATLTLGVFNSFIQQIRFAAGDAASPSMRGRAIGFTLFGGVIAAWLGPQIARSAHDAMAAPLAGAFLAWSFLAAACLIVFQFLRLPEVAPIVDKVRAKAEAWRVIRSPQWIFAAACGALAYLSMSLVMTATPLYMIHGQGHAFDSATTVIQWHVVAMFAPAFLTGPLTDRLGAAPVMVAGALLTIAVTPIAWGASMVGAHLVGLVVLGLGWNLLFTGASSAIAALSRPDTRAWVQGYNDLLVFGSSTLGVLGSGVALHVLGWQAVALAGALFGVIALFCALAQMRLQTSLRAD